MSQFRRALGTVFGDTATENSAAMAIDRQATGILRVIEQQCIEASAAWQMDGADQSRAMLAMMKSKRSAILVCSSSLALGDI